MVFFELVRGRREAGEAGAKATALSKLLEKERAISRRVRTECQDSARSRDSDHADRFAVKYIVSVKMKRAGGRVFSSPGLEEGTSGSPQRCWCY